MISTFTSATGFESEDESLLEEEEELLSEEELPESEEEESVMVSLGDSLGEEEEEVSVGPQPARANKAAEAKQAKMDFFMIALLSFA